MSANQVKSSASPAVGLDLGTSRIVVAKQEGEEFDVRSQLNSFVCIPFSRMTEKALEKEHVPFTRRDSVLMVHGNESARFADLLGLEPRRPMTGGFLNPAEPESVEAIHKIVHSLLGAQDGAGKLLFFGVPAAPRGGQENLTYHEAAVREMLSKSYKVTSISEGLAVVYAELENTNFTGVGVSFGGGLCNVCLAYLAVPLVSFSVGKAGDFIDASAAAVTGERTCRIRQEKETSFQLNGAAPNKTQQAIGVYYDRVIQAVVEGMVEAFSPARLPKFRQGVPVILSGGTSIPKGFLNRFEVALRASQCPLSYSEIRLAKDPLHATAKGLLKAALAEL